MTTDFRALCAELVDYWENDCPVTLAEVMERARVALAEPEPVPAGPSDDELDELFVEIDQSGESESWRAYARAVLARWGRPAPQPADGEVAELAAWLRGANWDRQRQTLATRAAELLERLSTTQKELERERLRLAACGAVAMADTPETAAKARDCLPEYWSASADDIARQIDKLMRLSPPQPVPVAERLPGPEDCDELGRVWWWYPETAGTLGYWQWEADAMERQEDEQPLHWLPAHALPQPS